jgi:hypothetical protein
MSDVKPLCVVLVALALGACAPVTYQPQTIDWLKQQIADPNKLQRLEGVNVKITGVVHGVATGSVFLDLRADAEKLIGTESAHPFIDECVGLVAPPDKFPSVEGDHLLTVYGHIFLQKVSHGDPPITVVHGIHNGVTYYFYCGYDFPGKYPHIELDRAERDTPE